MNQEWGSHISVKQGFCRLTRERREAYGMARLRPPFVDRVEELTYLVKLAEEGSPFPLFIYGPEGCGKTRLLEELTSRLRREGFTVIYVDAREATLGRALRGSIHGLVEVARELLASPETPVGRALARLLPQLVEAYERRYRFRGRRIVVLVDEVVEGVGVEWVEAYAKTLHELAMDLVEEYGAASVAVVATTSEGLSRERLSRHGYLHLSYLWNLDWEAFAELARALNAPEQLVEELYRITSGNPRALIDLASLGWNTRRWMEMTYRERVLQLLHERTVREHLDELGEVVEDPDNAVHVDPSLRRLLVEYNMIMYLGHPLTPSTRPKPSRDLGVGMYYAWQLNAYRLLLHEHLSGNP